MRYALYYAPAPGSALWNAGSRWLGRDAACGDALPQPAVDGIAPAVSERLTRTPRRYGFHATLKAPFRLAPGFTEDDLLTMAQAFAACQRPLPLGTLAVRTLGHFLALCPTGNAEDIQALAMRCVRYFDPLRAPPPADELARRHAAGLTPREQALLRRWGYPYTEEIFRFHLTLSDTLRGLDAATAAALRAAAESYFASASAVPPALDALAIFREDAPGEPFRLRQRFAFPEDASTSAASAGALPAPGTLFFLVGPSGAGKDALLDWVRQRLPGDADVAIAQRAITRPAHPSEPHEAMAPASFAQCTADGGFSMVWHANGLSYGIRRSVEALLHAGRNVIVNGSRESVPSLKRQFPQARVIWVDADPETLRKRLESRRRESGAAQAARLERALQFAPPAMRDLVRIDNSGPIELAGRRLLAALTGRR